MSDEDVGLAPRGGSVGSKTSTGSDTASGWTILNDHGTEVEDSVVQTDKRVMSNGKDDDDSDKDSSGPHLSSCSELDEGYFRVSQASSILSEEAEDSVSESDRIVEAVDVGRSFNESSASTILFGDKQKSEEGSSVFDMTEMIAEEEMRHQPAAPVFLDTVKVARLMDALSEAVERHNSTRGHSSSESVSSHENLRRDYPNAADESYCDDLPVNFVEMCRNKVRNYIHHSNRPLNWKLTFVLVVATAMVCGLGLGHFVGTTHSWIRRHRITQEQLHRLKTLQDSYVHCVDRLDGCHHAASLTLASPTPPINTCSPAEHPNSSVYQELRHEMKMLKQDINSCREEIKSNDQEIKILRSTNLRLLEQENLLRISLANLENSVNSLKTRLLFEMDSHQRELELLKMQLEIEKGKNADYSASLSSVGQQVVETIGQKKTQIMSSVNNWLNDSSSYLSHNVQKIKTKLGNFQVEGDSHLETILDTGNQMKDQLTTALTTVWQQTKELTTRWTDEHNSDQLIDMFNGLGANLQILLSSIASLESHQNDEVPNTSPRLPVQEFINALRRSSFSKILGKMVANSYFSDLASLDEFENERAKEFWSQCQLAWWTLSEGKLECDEQLYWWQTEPGVFDRKRFFFKNCRVGELLGLSGFCKNKKKSFNSWAFFQHRAEGRKDIRKREHESDWMFDRSSARKYQRESQELGYERAEWAFKRGKKRKEYRVKHY